MKKFIFNKEKLGQNPLIFLNVLILVFFLGSLSVKNDIWHYNYSFSILLLSLVIAFYLVYKEKFISIIFIIFFVFSLGAIRTEEYINPPKENIIHYINEEINFEGEISYINSVKEKEDSIFVSYIVDLKNITKDGKVAPLKGKVYLNIKATDEKNIFKIGDILKANGTVKNIKGYFNFGTINAIDNATMRGIYASINGKDGSIKVVKEEKGFNIYQKAYEFRQSLMEYFLKYLDKDNAHLLYAMLFGGYDGIDPEVIDAYTKTGIIHILSVSGGHIALLIGFMMILSRILHLPKSLQIISTVLVIVIYAFLCGFVTPIIRASIMGILSIVAVFFGREKDAKNSLSLIALIMIIINPMLLYNISFQLSFISTAGLIYLMPKIRQVLYFLPEFIKSSLALTISVQIFTLPVLAYYFNVISLVSIFANLLAVPLMEIVIILGLVSTLFTDLPFLSGSILYFLGSPLDIANFIVMKLASFPFAQIHVPTMPAFLVIIFYVMIYIFLKDDLYKKIIILLNKNTILTLIFIAIISFALVFFNFKNDKLAIHFLDIGQGDSTLIVTPHGHKILIDTGGLPQIDGDKNQFSLGKRVLLPALYHFNTRKIDYLILSHSDQDHIGAAKDLLKVIPVEELIISPEDKKIYSEKLALKDNHPLLQRAIIGRENLHFVIDNVEFTFLYPFWEMNKLEGNKASSVIKLKYKDFTILFTGDVEKDGEEAMLLKGTNVKANILKVAHHGSNTSSTEDFIKNVNPQIAIISAGKDNKFGHPKQEVLDTLKKNNIKVLRTDEKGAISIYTNGENINIKSYFK